nr:MFS transporter [Candidatus Cloacimonadota bacterium]
MSEKLNQFIERFFNIFRGFKNRNYSLYFFGQGTSLIGTWIQRTALSWLIYRITDSVFWLGLIGFVGHIPSLVITPFAGVIADKYSRHKILKVSQTCSMIQALSLSALVFYSDVQIWQILLLSVFLGVIEAFE